MSGKIFVALSSFCQNGDEPKKLLEKSGLSYFLNPLKRRLVEEEVIEMGKDSSGIIAGLEPYNDQVLDNLPKLKCISRCGVGIDNISLIKAKEKGIKIYNTPGVVIQPVAELAVGMIFDLLKRLSLQTFLMKAGKWQKKPGNLLLGKKVGILGLGRIGRKTAEILRKLGLEVYGCDINPDKQWVDRIGVKLVSMEELLKICDILSIHLSFSEDNPFQLGKKEIAIMKEQSFVVNVSRGKFIDEEALYEALESGHLAGAALDVFTREPYDGKLCQLDNVVLTPHIATLAKESRLEMETQAAKNITEYFSS